MDDKASEKTSGRKGPKASATDFDVGTRRKGLDGNMWTVVATRNGTQRWQRNPPKPPKGGSRSHSDQESANLSQVLTSDAPGTVAPPPGFSTLAEQGYVPLHGTRSFETVTPDPAVLQRQIDELKAQVGNLSVLSTRTKASKPRKPKAEKS